MKYIFELNPAHQLAKRAADTGTTRSSANGWNCCWIRRYWPRRGTLKIRTSLSAV
ncbi:hypothetical protein LNP74_03535 [Klebsiella pneumoniae subsp. pneumoniae]|nr:hypothetical protein [Klebsiella pneumoniae subsp. pneumoniae]